MQNKAKHDVVAQWLIDTDYIVEGSDEYAELIQNTVSFVEKLDTIWHFNASKVKKIPSEIIYCKNLDYLRLEGANNLEILPQELFLLPKLEKICVFGGIEKIFIQDKKNNILKGLSLFDNNLKKFPIGISKLANLEEIDFGNSIIKNIVINNPMIALRTIKINSPEMYCEDILKWMPNLEYIYLNGDIPNNWQGYKLLPKLISIEFEANNLVEFPSFLKDMPALKAITFRQNSIKKIPDWVQEKSSINWLEFRNNNDTELNQSINLYQKLFSRNMYVTNA